MAYKGRFIPKNPEKYKGDVDNITYRSLWERDCMKTFDTSKSVISWASEEVIIPYISPVDKKAHRYFVDFAVKMRLKDNSTQIMLVEVKPYKQTIPPKTPKRKTKRYFAETFTYATNKAKWLAAEEYCKQRDWEFKILTEKDIYG